MSSTHLPLDPAWHITGFSINAVLQAVDSLAGDTSQLLAQIDVNADDLQYPDSRFPVSKLFYLYPLAEQQTHNPDIALLAGRIGYINRLNMQLYIMSVCKTFREYLKLMPSILSFEGDIGEVQVRLEGDFLYLDWLPLCTQSSQQRYLTDQVLGLAALIVSSLCIKEIPLLGVNFTYPKPDNCQQLERAFGTKLNFQQPVSSLCFPKNCLDYPLTQLYSNWHHPLQASIEHLFAEQSEDEFLTNLRRTMHRLLPRGEMTIDTVAEALNISRRTLQRRLSDRGCVFRQLLQDLRSELALQYLADQRLSITDVAFLLGYSDQGSFTVAFKSWQSVAPSEYRQASVIN